MDYIYPDYSNSSVNLTGSILDGYGIPSPHKPLSQLGSKPLGEYRHLIFAVFDGMGWDFLNTMNSNIAGTVSECRKISSVFPSTTTAAVTSLMTGYTPVEHGYLGWTLYLKEYNRYINALLGTDNEKQRNFYEEGIDYHGIMEPGSVLEQIKSAQPARDVWYVAPKEFGASLYTARTSRGGSPVLYSYEQEIPAICQRIAGGNTPSCSFVYSPFPDYFEHNEGTGGASVKRWFDWFTGFIETMNGICSKTDTIVLISTDHGMIDMDGYYKLEEDPVLMDSLIMPPFPESRFASFFVKEHKRDRFAGRFSEKLGDEFLLFEREEFLGTSLLGTGKEHRKIDDFIGNYIAVAIGRTGIHCNPVHNPAQAAQFKANHAGLTREEIEIPLLIIDRE